MIENNLYHKIRKFDQIWILPIMKRIFLHEDIVKKNVILFLTFGKVYILIVKLT